jgi:hypothetical protein
MFDSSDDTEVVLHCAGCRLPLHGSRYAQVEGRAVSFFCSLDCVHTAARQERSVQGARRRRGAVRLLLGLGLLGLCLTPDPPFVWAAGRPTVASPAPPQPEPQFGPAWPPTEEILLAELAHDAWTHPMAGPYRRMPIRPSRVFGADRPGDRPIECVNGHCGVDLGGEIWGEHVHAAHDGVVDRVQRDPNEHHGGHYVRLSHLSGTVYTQYFHLAAIPRRLQPGVAVKAGDVIGLLGDSGVKESEPHLHFTVSVRPTVESSERYMDPEPLVALWPVRIPVLGSPVRPVAVVALPALPIGAATLRPGRKQKLAARRITSGPSSAEGRIGPSEAASHGDTEPDPAPSAAE